MFGHTMLLIKQGGIPLINYIAQTNILREVVFSGTAPKHLGQDLSSAIVWW